MVERNETRQKKSQHLSNTELYDIFIQIIL